MERVWFTPRRGFSARSIFMFVLTVFLTALLWATFGTHETTHAADPVANWKGTTLLYNGHQYNANNTAKKDNTLGLPEGTNYYTYVEDSGNTSTGSTAKTVKAMVIYFAPGVDPPNAKSATLATYDYNPAKGYSNQSDKKTITVTPDGGQSSLDSCTVSGIGWIICPVTVFMAGGMDWIFEQVANFMAVQPVTMGGENASSLYTAWNIMRTIANIAFIIVFLIIIYAQLTSTAVSNYGIKKLLPRLIIASLLVNLSFIISSIAVDISNILGYSLQQVFIHIRQETFSITNDTWSAGTSAWTAVTAAVLSGVGIGALIANPGLIYLLVPLLLGMIATALVVLIILAARQAIIVILIILSPLAFVAYLLPNTETWFKKWRELFMTMLIFFPAFSLVFGGSQLASSIIMQNATSMPMIVIGLAVQVAPLVITPLILRFSGGVLGRIAGLVNNPKKGFLDKSKNWANKRADLGRQRALANPNTKNPFRRISQRMAYADRRVDKDTERNKAEYEDWASRRDITTRKGQEIESATAMAKLSTEASHHEMGQAMEEARAGNSDKLRALMRQDPTVLDKIRAAGSGSAAGPDATKEERQAARQAAAAEFSNARYARQYEVDIDPATGAPREENGKLVTKTRYAKYVAELSKRAVELDQHNRVTEYATAVAKNKQLTNYATMVQGDEHVRVEAGGIGGLNAQQGALAAAFKATAGAHNEAVANASSIISHYNLGNDTVVEITRGNQAAVEGKFTITDTIKEAAILQIAGGKDAGALLNMMGSIEISDSQTDETAISLRQAYADTILTNGAKPKFIGAKMIADIKQGIMPKGADGAVLTGKARLDYYVAQTINANKLSSAEVLVTEDRDYLNQIWKTLENNEGETPIDAKKLRKINNAIQNARKNPIYEGRIAEREEALGEIQRLIQENPAVQSLPPETDAEASEPIPTDDE